MTEPITVTPTTAGNTSSASAATTFTLTRKPWEADDEAALVEEDPGRDASSTRHEDESDAKDED
jgi:hypothetical protein